MKKILALPGSIRKDSYNKLICKELEKLSPENLSIEAYFIDEIPFFSEDLESDLPKSVKNLISKLEESNAVIISTPEYNNMIPGVLKNTCEWLTRPYSKATVQDKPLGIMGASTGGFGTVRAQNQMLLLGGIMRFRTYADLRLPISNADQKFSDKGELVDLETKRKMRDFVDNLAQLIL